MLEYEIIIENIVITGTFSEPIDLNTATTQLENSKRNWKRFPGLIYKQKTPPATFLLFRTGKFVCTGTKTQTRGHTAITTFLEQLKTKNLVSNNCTTTWEIKNLVATINIGGVSIALEEFINQFESALYEQEKFPAAVYKMEKTKATFLVFLTGKLICAGIANEETLKQTIKTFYDQLVEKNIIEKNLTP
ncbi:MAG: hypothetical protein LBQ98_05820 [Nitrososphaerota archaeon]|nr:hypothetical protein [Nitrososphaerota archaeon]